MIHQRIFYTSENIYLLFISPILCIYHCAHYIMHIIANTSTRYVQNALSSLVGACYVIVLPASQEASLHSPQDRPQPRVLHFLDWWLKFIFNLLLELEELRRIGGQLPLWLLLCARCADFFRSVTVASGRRELELVLSVWVSAAEENMS